MENGRKICVGRIMGVHGVRGHVRLRSLTEDPEDVLTYSPITDETGEHVFDLKLIGVMKDHFVVSIKGVVDRNAAEALRGTKLFVGREALPETAGNTFYEADLIGLCVQREDGQSIGKVLALHDYGAGAFLEIQPTVGASFMLPFTNACVPSVDVKAGVLSAVIPNGWLDPARAEKEAQ